MKKIIVLIVLAIVGIKHYHLSAQTVETGSFKSKSFQIKDSIEVAEDRYIIPESVRLYTSDSGQSILDSGQIILKILSKKILLINQTKKIISGRIEYNVLAFSPEIHISVFDSNRIENIETRAMGYKYQPPAITKKNNSTFLHEGGVEYAGAFGRGLSFGNNQNLVLQSTLNMQLSGKIGDDIEINAAISDESIPIQADGNTQQLNELDKVFIEIKRKNLSLVAGDIQVKPADTYFLKYFKKYKGIQLHSVNTIDKKNKLHTTVQGSIARGNFKRQTLLVQEGNQGPYRLTGISNELFIIVLSGSEKVFLDGVVLLRGLEEDYVIDYNRAEISFTSKRIINQNSRVVIEFEYSNQSYLKTALALQTKYQTPKWTIQWNTYQETDNKTSNVLQTLTLEDKLALAQAGDNTKLLERSSIRTSTEESISYILKDTIVQGDRYENILVLDLNQKSGITATFTYVGSGNGNYLVENDFFTNGRSYRWVAPDKISKTKKGEYEPSYTLVAPKKQNQHGLRIVFHPNDKLSSSTEIGLSNLDVNTYSSLDRQDDKGIAWKQNIKYKLSGLKYKWMQEVQAEKQSKNFSLFEPFRNPEFNRDWGLINQLSKNGDDFLMRYNTQLEFKKIQSHYSFQKYQKQSQYDGQMHHAGLQLALDKLSIKSSLNAMQNKFSSTRSTFIRPHVEVRQSIGSKNKHAIGLQYDEETNKFSDLDPNLLPQSFSFKIIQSFLQGTWAQDKMNYQISFSSRQDQKINQNQFTKHYTSNEFSINNQWTISPHSSFLFRLTNRNLIFNSPINESEKNKNTLIYRQSFSTRDKKQIWRYHETIEGGTGQEPAIEYTYVKVNKGAGFYTWVDINNDSSIQVSEFAPAQFADQAEYLRYAITGNQFSTSKNYTFLQTIEWDGKQINASDKNKWYQFLSWASTINYQWKGINSTGLTNPFSLDDPALLSLHGQMRNQLYINRGGRQGEIQLGQLHAANKWRLSTGSDIKKSNELFMRSRYTLTKLFTLELYTAVLLQSNTTEFFSQKDIRQTKTIIEPLINYQTKQSFRLSAAYRYQSGEEKLQNIRTNYHEWRMELTANPKSKWSIRGSSSYVFTTLSTQVNPWVEFNLLQGLRAGQNILLNVNIDRMLNNNTILRIGYSGRKSSDSKYIQTGNAQILANF